MNLDQFRAKCAALPGATRDIKWQTREVWSVAGKMFAVLSLDSGHLAVKVGKDRFLELTDRPGVSPAPYLARHGWIALDNTHTLPATELAALINTSWRLVRDKLPAKVRHTLPLPDQSQ
ncbi:MmcQ/YjbR family DNA-binding protein [Silvimonas iriomotensis]|uniref:DNA-binding protein (MmcQ/YjbR family) n=1 Tax=Silvimonas iriomotensis TaxID=449662 RepID=A0ABQ2PEC3_9NEIS|nr:MmcQ/YjbR family DNA-binding protein [Silvimonas iriomotensis]GGP23611.1 hypothetical protein GCM10010970_36110 [Silvimonas iriomotensis]